MTLADLIDAPLEYVVMMEGVALSRDGAKLVGACPFHNDSEPSFAIWNYGGRDFAGCWACGFGPTDAIGFIRKLKGVDYPTALVLCNRYAKRVLEDGWDRTVLPTQDKKVNIRDFTHQATRALDAVPYAAIQFLRNRGLGTDAEWLMERYRFGGDDKWIVVPHYTPSGNHVTAIKYREQGSGLKTMDDGTLAFLYGCWEDVGQPFILVTEGESDCWRMASYFRTRPHVLVLSLPSGAKGPRQVWLDAIGPRRLAVLFDGDEAGRRAADAWCTERPDARNLTLGMPEGSDASDLTNPQVDALLGE